MQTISVEHSSVTDPSRLRTVGAADMALRTDGTPIYLVQARDTDAEVVTTHADGIGVTREPASAGAWHEVDRETWLDACRLIEGEEE